MSDARSSASVFPRTWLFVPAHQSERVRKALASSAEAVIVDLEDGVPLDQRDAALQTLRNLPVNTAEARDQWYVRVHPVNEPTFETDVQTAMHAGAKGVLLAKAETEADVQHAASLLSASCERFDIVPLVETPAGLLNAARIAGAAEHVTALMLGAEDLAVRLGPYVGQTALGTDMQHARWTLALAAAARGVAAIDMVCPAVRDAARLTRECQQACEMGFSAKAIIHPDQIEVVHEVMRPSAERVAWAHRVLAAAAEAQARGDAAVAVDGQMVDPPIVQRARQTIALAGNVRKGQSNDG